MASARDPARLRAARREARRLARAKNPQIKQFNRARQLRHEVLQKALTDKSVEAQIDTNELARQAGYARWGKADPRYEQAWSKYWYHDKDNSGPDSESFEDRYFDEDEDELCGYLQRRN